MESLLRGLSIAFVVSMTIALPAGGSASAGHGWPVPTYHIHQPPYSTSITPAQVQQLIQHQEVNNRVIVILKHQFMALAGRAYHLTVARDSAIATSQRGLLTQMREARASHIKSFGLINAISARLPKAEIRYLRSRPDVRAVVKDRRVYLPKLQPERSLELGVKKTPAHALTRHQTARRSASCSTSDPLLEPQALTQIKARFQNPKRDGQAALLATGKGINVGIMADGIDLHNPDFVRPDGSSAFVDAQDFTGSGGILATGGANEGMLDASSIGAQGNNRYYIGQFANSLNPAFNPDNGCPVIKVVGVAPGANMVDLQVLLGLNNHITSYVEAIQYAVDTGVNVLNQSFVTSFYPDQNTDPIALADAAANARGVVVVAATGDAGPTGTNGSPATLPGTIAAGATTSFAIYKQLGDGGSTLSDGDYVDNGISAFSSGGPAQSGLKSVDIVAPGDYNWILCDQSQPHCTDYNGQPAGVAGAGGTSQSAPLTAGAAALVMQAYRDTHNGELPSPAVVKQIIMSTATDLHMPTDVQGAGLLNVFQAVQLAKSYNLNPARRVGNNLAVDANGCTSSSSFTCNLALSAEGQPGSTRNLAFSVTNQGQSSQEVNLSSRMLAPSKSDSGTVALDASSGSSFYDAFGLLRRYATTTTVVRPGTNVLDVSVGWDLSSQPGRLVRLALLDPTGAYAGYSQPQGISGFGEIPVRDPEPGKWTLIMFTRADANLGFSGTVNWTALDESYVSAGPVTPSERTLMPGESRTFTFRATIPPRSGDGIADVLVSGEKSGAMTLPVILRSDIPATLAAGGTFSGLLKGGNGRFQSLNQQTYRFIVPAGANDLSLGLALRDTGTNHNIIGMLTAPDGTTVDEQSNVTDFDAGFNPVSLTNTIQFFRVAPQAGAWTLTLGLNITSGPMTSEPFTGKIAFNAAKVSSANVPNDTNTMLTNGTTYNAAVTVTNTGNQTEYYYLDPRNDFTTSYVAGGDNNGGYPIDQYFFLVPPETSHLSALEGNFSGGPLHLQVQNINGTSPRGYPNTPDLYAGGPGSFQDIEYSPPNSEVPSGFWIATSDNLTPGFSPANFDTLAGEAIVTTQNFDTSITSDTGDFWQAIAGVNPNFEYQPLVLAPGAMGTINVAITPDQPSGTHVSGHLYLNTVQFTPPGCNAASCVAFTTGSGGAQVASIPFDYTVS